MEKTRACVAVKVGEFGHTSRTSVPVEDAEFEFDEGRDNFERVYSLADGNVSSALAKYTTKTTRPDVKLYLTPSQHAKQAQFMALTSETWPGMLAQARTNYHKQKTFDGPFVVHLLMYAANKVRQGICRATPTRIAEAAEAIDSYLAERQDVRVGDIARTHWAISHTGQPDDAGVTLPESATFRQMQHLDAMSAARHEGDREEGVYRTLTLSLNGSRDMQLTLNIEELRAVLQLPNYSLIAEGLFSNF
ncbi:hypothetical protein PC129_g2501 [Phytophthora cactorum]|uniref:Uncharacterized protein n=2 Tax=Phytophthora cactorum TaxID=29920 RepID=A0A8T1LIB3_9STRA|nr:hypothetical protein Pcac1_g10790 [Phytophthora cactorum]KAG2839149.1 hypothetical protein PC112_g4223 [Phytophthora cactorum]KAG2841162.1 hypothetical protein PC111_g3199 [Phytophthora cactorum]KAG2864941.1 hypothetical protein PC113_g4119 [Phytophthora cactorum]KAG2924154.1 hypothetical protein PC114_g4594 [Phytophthora cactorum]